MFTHLSIFFRFLFLIFLINVVSCGKCVVKSGCRPATQGTQDWLDSQINNNNSAIPSEVDRRNLCISASNIAAGALITSASAYSNYATNSANLPCVIYWSNN